MLKSFSAYIELLFSQHKMRESVQLRLRWHSANSRCIVMGAAGGATCSYHLEST